MTLNPYILLLLLSFSLTVNISGAEKNDEVEKLPSMGEGIVFPNHLMMKVSDSTRFAYYDNNTEKYVLNFNELILKGLKEIPDIFRNRIPSIPALKTHTVLFNSQIKNEYDYSDKWTDRKHIITIKDFEKTGYEYDISTYLGPLSNIPTALHGIATFDLKFDGTAVRFKSYASKKLFSIKNQYWAYFDVYTPPKQFAGQLRLLILMVSEPNNYLKDNGTYFLVPITEDDRKRYHIQ